MCRAVDDFAVEVDVLGLLLLEEPDEEKLDLLELFGAIADDVVRMVEVLIVLCFKVLV